MSAIPGIIAALEVSTSNAVADVLILVGAAEVVTFSVIDIIIVIFRHTFSLSVEMIVQFNLYNKIVITISDEERTGYNKITFLNVFVVEIL